MFKEGLRRKLSVSMNITKPGRVAYPLENDLVENRAKEREAVDAS